MINQTKRHFFNYRSNALTMVSFFYNTHLRYHFFQQVLNFFKNSLIFFITYPKSAIFYRAESNPIVLPRLLLTFRYVVKFQLLTLLTEPSALSAIT